LKSKRERRRKGKRSYDFEADGLGIFDRKMLTIAAVAMRTSAVSAVTTLLTAVEPSSSYGFGPYRKLT
jgi:hypothetical protein